jgi:deoxyribodipyrimidine photolyase-related protein
MGENACPTTTLYWNFLITHYYTFSRNPRTALMAKNIDRLSGQDIAAVQTQAQYLLNNINAI